MVILDYLRALLFDWRKNVRSAEAHAAPPTSTAKVPGPRVSGPPSRLRFPCGRQATDPAKVFPRSHRRKKLARSPFMKPPQTLALMFLTVEDYRSVCDDYEFEQITQEPREARSPPKPAALEPFPLPPQPLRH